MTPEVRLARAERLGHRLQRYTLVSPGSLGTENNANVVTRDLSRTRYGSTYSETRYKTLEKATDPRVEKETENLGTAKTKRSNQGQRLPDFRVSESGTLAVPDGGQAKNFYAEAATVTATNQVLGAAGTPLRLLSAGHGVSVPSDPEDLRSPPRRLKKVHAAREIPPDALHAAQVEIATAFDVMNCDDFIQQVLGAATGASRKAVLENAETGTQVPAQPNQEPVSRLAGVVSQKKPPTPATASQKLAGPDPNNATLQQNMIKYERLSDVKRSNRAARLGINEFASPEVGEGFVIRSQNTERQLNPQNEPTTYGDALEELEDAEENLAQGRRGVSARVESMLRTWGQHYAGVVAKDGPDVVTLENYNRVAEVRWEHERIFNNLYRDFEAFRTLVAGQVGALNQTPGQQQIQNLVQLAAAQAPKLAKKYKAALKEAQTSFATGLALTQRTTDENFFFQMYGPGDQSFHSTYSAMASNPVTLRIREATGPVADEARTTVDGFDNLATQIAADVQQNQVTGVTASLQLVLQQANASVVTLRQDLAAAVTRADFKAIDDRATAGKRTLRDQMLNRLIAGYQTVTGTAHAGNSFAGLRAAVTTYIDSYSFYQKLSARYRSITALRDLLTALATANL